LLSCWITELGKALREGLGSFSGKNSELTLHHDTMKPLLDFQGLKEKFTEQGTGAHRGSVWGKLTILSFFSIAEAEPWKRNLSE
jgi:hypothetical protein